MTSVNPRLANVRTKKKASSLDSSQRKEKSYWLLTAIVVVIMAVGFSFYWNDLINVLIETLDKDGNDINDRFNEMFKKKLSKAPKISPNVLNISRNVLAQVKWRTGGTFLRSLIKQKQPVLIENSPISSWHLYNWNLLDIATSYNITLNNARYQTTPLYVLGHERDKGGMIGGKNDRYKALAYTDVPLDYFLKTASHDKKWLYWKGELSNWENQMNLTSALTGTSERNFTDGWQSFRVVDEILSESIDIDDATNWRSILWLSQPGTTAHTHYDTEHNFLAHLQGVKTVLLFPPSTEMYTYPNIHRSFRQSQIHLEDYANFTDLISTFPMLETSGLRALEVTLTPGSILYIPPFWNHRVLSETVALSLSILSPSGTEAQLNAAYWQPVPFGQLKASPQHRMQAVMHYLTQFFQHVSSLNTTLQMFAAGIYKTRYEKLYPPHWLNEKFSLDALSCELIDLNSSNETAKVVSPASSNNQDTNDSNIAIDDEIRSLLIDLKDKFIEASTQTANMLEEIDVDASVKKAFCEDYTEQLSRWAVGPPVTAVFIYKCLARMHL